MKEYTITPINTGMVNSNKANYLYHNSTHKYYDVEGNGGSGSNADSGSLQGKYGIPESCDTEIATGDSGIQKIAIDAEEVIVPDTGDLYVASFRSIRNDGCSGK